MIFLKDWLEIEYWWQCEQCHRLIHGTDFGIDYTPYMCETGIRHAVGYYCLECGYRYNFIYDYPDSDTWSYEWH